jgi:hypothetical protein
MTSSKAYIATFSTTGLLVGLAVLLLIVVSALMTFRERADADRGPATAEVIVEAAEPPRAGVVSERVAARAAEPPPSTRGVVVTRPGAGPAAPEAPGAEVLGRAPGASDRGAPTAATAPQPAGGGGGIELGAKVDPLVDPVSPGAGDPLGELLEQLGGAFPREEPAAGYER